MSILSLRSHRGLGLSPRRRAAAAGPTLPIIVQDGLVAEWRFDGGSGQVIVDHSGNGNNALLGPTPDADSGEPTWSSTGVDCVLNAANNWVSTGSTLGISGGAARTVICVAQMNRVDGNTEGPGFGSWTGGAGAGSRWWFSPIFNTNNLAIITNGGQRHEFMALNPIPNATWTFVALTQSGANINTCVGYRDGAVEAATANVALSTTGSFEIQSRGSSSGVLTWGKVAYQVVYNRALSGAEVEQNRQTLKTILAGRGSTLP
jgi:hypothetical protein